MRVLSFNNQLFILHLYCLLMSFNIPQTDKKRVVIVGGGFGGMELANRLNKSGYQVILIDKNNYHQFLPLIYQVASAGIEPSSISFPFRSIYKKRNKDLFFRLAEARAVVPEKNILQTSIGKIQYDYLVFAAGTVPNYFGNKHIEEVAMPMKNISEAVGLRNAILSNFERAITCADKQEREELLNIVIVGGGATGIEIAGALSEMKRFVIPKEYPEIDPNELKIYLIEAADRLLQGMSPKSSEASARFLSQMGVHLMFGEKVTDYNDHKVIFENGHTIPTRTFIWTSGVKAASIGNIPSEKLGRGGRITVNQYNCVEGYDNIFAIGDQCIMYSDEQFPHGHPQLAQVAIQQGRLLAKNLAALRENRPLKAFKYKDLGSMATIGRNKAVADIGKMHLEGFCAWAMWLLVHLRSILGVRNKLVVLLNWIWNYITYDQSVRLIMYAREAAEVRKRRAKEMLTHWGEDILPSLNKEKRD